MVPEGLGLGVAPLGCWGSGSLLRLQSPRWLGRITRRLEEVRMAPPSGCWQRPLSLPMWPQGCWAA